MLYSTIHEEYNVIRYDHNCGYVGFRGGLKERRAVGGVPAPEG